VEGIGSEHDKGLRESAMKTLMIAHRAGMTGERKSEAGVGPGEQVAVSSNALTVGQKIGSVDARHNGKRSQ
jgi:hypothetical protein